MIEIYVDGSCRKNQYGGFGICIIDNFGKIIYQYGEQVSNTTNNRMELQALLYALDLTQTKYKDKKCVIKSDSAYCVNMYNEWIYNWNKNGWVRYGNKPIENLDLVKQIWEYCKLEWPNFIVEKVPGHSGLLGNEIADCLATNNKAKLHKIFDENDIHYEKEENIDLY